eukprot:TRINITY_DN42441_c0_g1_i1.p1 TRINITY_DN42441_c0_g1~~TRINITY_DN42441_c0_g1_i1.p1  ORF type:complete len:102 (+),score=23.53 TRINITY_DN42441_c0_g1_i1:153-458(+)
MLRSLVGSEMCIRDREYRDRIAASFLKGQYILPSGLDRGGHQGHSGDDKENIASLTSKQNADCQTEVTTTRDVGLGDGDIDALPPETVSYTHLTLPTKRIV